MLGWPLASTVVKSAESVCKAGHSLIVPIACLLIITPAFLLVPRWVYMTQLCWSRWEEIELRLCVTPWKAEKATQLPC